MNLCFDELLDVLVLEHTPGTADSVGGLHMATALFGLTVVPSFSLVTLEVKA